MKNRVMMEEPEHTPTKAIMNLDNVIDSFFALYLIVSISQFKFCILFFHSVLLLKIHKVENSLHFKLFSLVKHFCHLI